MQAPNLTPNYTEGDAAYNAEAAALQHQYETTLASDQEALKDNWANATYQRALMGKGEPQALHANASRMNSAGLLESGANAQARTNSLTNAAQRRAAITVKLAQDEKNTAAHEAAAGTQTTDAINKAVAEASERRARAIAESEARDKPQPTTPAPASPGLGAAPPGYEWVKLPGGSYQMKPKALPIQYRGGYGKPPQFRTF